MKNCPKIYTGQALAISMIVLVVCAILGISIYSRVMKDQALVAEEAISSEVLEMADSILGTMTAVSASDLKDLIEQNEGDIKITGWTDVNQFFEDLKLVNLTDTLSDLDQCDSNNSEIELTVVNATIDDLIEVSVDEAKGFRIEGKGFTNAKTEPCMFNIYTESRGTSSSGFMLKKIYATGYGTDEGVEYKIYDEDDILLYCFSDDLNTCNSSDFTPDANWKKIPDGSTIEVNLKEKKDGYRLDEVRIIPVGGTIAIGVDIPEVCMEDEDLGAVRVVASVTCNGIYRAKEMFIPEEGASSYSSIFDYTIYNNVGELDL